MAVHHDHFVGDHAADDHADGGDEDYLLDAEFEVVVVVVDDEFEAAGFDVREDSDEFVEFAVVEKGFIFWRSLVK